MRTKRLIVATFLAFFLPALNYAILVAADRPSASGLYDVVIANGKIVDGSGNPIWRTGTTSAATVSLEDCSGCGEIGRASCRERVCSTV